VTENAGQGTDTAEAFFSASLAIISANVENLTLIGGDLAGTGNGLNNVIKGTSGENTLSGDAGNDTLDGGGGDDTLKGGVGNDVYIVDSLADVINEFPGDGTADELRSKTGANIDLTTAALLNIENATLLDGLNLKITGNTLNNVLTGDSGNNTLIGGSGNDTLNGGDGHDELDGGSGNDSMTGGKGNDVYIVDSTADKVTEKAGEGSDGVVASLAAYTLGAEVEMLQFDALAGVATGTGNALNNRMFANNSGNKLDGAGGNDTLFGGSGKDTMIGGIGNDSLQGGGDADLLQGGAGNDVLNGEAGNDTMQGGVGNDQYILDSASDVVTEIAGQGSDTVFVGFSADLSKAAFANIEHASLTSIADGVNLTGNGVANVLEGEIGANTLSGLGGNDNLFGFNGNDTLLGGDGNDTLNGGSGTDSMNGGLGNDVYEYTTGDTITESAGQGTDEVRGQFDIDMSAMANVENGTVTGADQLDIEGNSLNNILTGNTAGNDLEGAAGNDTLNGGDGNDSLDGGSGNDKMVGGKGDDEYVVADSGDLVVESAGQGEDWVFAAISYTLTANVENLTLNTAGNASGTGNTLDNEIEGLGGKNTLDGGAGNDTLFGGGGIDSLLGGAGNDELDGEAGDDTMKGGLGDDTYVVDAVGDVVTEVAAQGKDLIKTTLTSFDLTTKGANVEGLTYTGSADAILTGNTLDNTIQGGSGNDTIDGKTGNDSLKGGSGNDTLTGGNGNDTLNGESGDNELFGGKGNDTYVLLLSSFINNLVWEDAGEGTDTVETDQDLGGLVDEVENLKLLGTDDLIGIGNHHANVITGNSGNNLLTGEAGTDTIIGGDGNDTYTVDESGDKIVETATGGADDIVNSFATTYTLSDHIEQLIFDLSLLNVTGTGGATDNAITGTLGTDLLDGAAGDDQLAGLDGNDTLFGGFGRDYIEGNEGNDAIFGGGDGDNLSGGDGDDTIDGGAGNDEMTGGAGNDTLIGGAGNDEYIVIDSGDKVQEAAGSGNDLVGAGISLIIPDNVEDAYLIVSGLTVDGNSLDNAMFGTDGADTMNGGVGNDVLEGGLGVDKLSGGTGNDQFRYELDFLADLATLGGDVITGFEVGKDTIDLYDLFADFGIASANPIGEGFLELQVIGGNTNIRFDSDGGADSFVTLATLQGVTTASIADIIHPQPDQIL
jgi:Ca2+-binding RTX toxin-like protein